MKEPIAFGIYAAEFLNLEISKWPFKSPPKKKSEFPIGSMGHWYIYLLIDPIKKSMTL